MQDNILDSKIKSALENFEVPYDASTWDLLASKMEALDNPVPVDEVDKVVARSLGHLEPAYQSAHWDMLESKMRTANLLRRRIIVSKLAEAAIFLLLAWNFGNLLFAPDNTRPAPSKPKYNGPVAENQATRKPRTNVAPNATTENAEIVFPGNSPAGMSASDPTGGTYFIENQIQNAAFGTSFVNLENFSNDNPAGIFTGNQQAANAVFAANDGASAARSASLADLAFLPATYFGPVEKSAELPQFGGIVIKKKKEKHFYVSNYAALAHNRIATPYDENFKKEAYQQWAGGYGGGMAVGARKGLWGAEIGVVYASKRYNPRKTIEIYDGNAQSGFRGSALTEVDMDVVSVPVNVNRQVARFGKTTLRARAGVSANFAVQTAHRYQTLNLPPAQPDPQNPANTLGGSPKFAQRGTGLLEGGQASGNTWATADAGLRLERPVGRHFTAFAETVYSQNIGGRVGPKRSKIGGLGVHAGVLTYL